jgi:hypothetical protein
MVPLIQPTWDDLLADRQVDSPLRQVVRMLIGVPPEVSEALSSPSSPPIVVRGLPNPRVRPTWHRQYDPTVGCTVYVLCFACGTPHIEEDPR